MVRPLPVCQSCHEALGGTADIGLGHRVTCDRTSDPPEDGAGWVLVIWIVSAVVLLLLVALGPVH